MNSFSQTVTETQSNDTSFIKIHKKYVKYIIKDLIRGDMYRITDSIKSKTINFYEKRIIYKDSLLDVYRDKEANYRFQIDQCEDKNKIYDETINQLSKNLKKEKREKTFSRIAGIVAVGLLSYFYITK